MRIMNRDIAEISTSEGGEELPDPNNVRPIADLNDENAAISAGFAYDDKDYGYDAWIACKTSDLMDVRM
jgi:hypothetical protein